MTFASASLSPSIPRDYLFGHTTGPLIQHFFTSACTKALVQLTSVQNLFLAADCRFQCLLSLTASSDDVIGSVSQSVLHFVYLISLLLVYAMRNTHMLVCVTVSRLESCGQRGIAHAVQSMVVDRHCRLGKCLVFKGWRRSEAASESNCERSAHNTDIVLKIPILCNIAVCHL